MPTKKMKGLLKGLRYISKIFESENEVEMQIGLPTDVKHVAHIGWDTQSVSSPSWMNGFSTPPSFSSAPLSLPPPGEDVPIKWVSEDSTSKGGRATKLRTRDLPELPKSSRRQPVAGNLLPPTSAAVREKTDKPKSRRSSKHKDSSDKKQSIRGGADQIQGNDDSLGIPRNNRRKKTTASDGGSIVSKPLATESYTSPYSDPGSGYGSILISNNTGLCQ